MRAGLEGTVLGDLDSTGGAGCVGTLAVVVGVFCGAPDVGELALGESVWLML